MSSTFPVFASPKSEAFVRTFNTSEMGRCALLGVMSLGLAWRPAHASLSSWIVATVALAVVCLAEQRDRRIHSPLDIDATVRLLRSVGVAALLMIGEVVLFPQARAFAVRAFLGFASLSLCAALTFRAAPSSVVPAISVAEEGAGIGRIGGKRMLDLAGALLACLLLSPLLLLITLAVKLESRGPVFFTQERVGFRGKRFRILKFRSMLCSAPAYQRSPSDSHDPRITRVGRILRRLGLDELPQLINVLRGEMSMVGPRPEMPFIVRSYTREQRARLNAVPGITGLWQISPARALPIHENLHYDLYYIAHRSLLLDLAIVVRTFSSVIRGVGAF